MTNRLLSVNAYTTLDLVAAEIETHDAVVDLDGVADVTVEDAHPNRVTLAVESDTVGVDAVGAHADRLRLTPEQARRLGAALNEHADRIEDGD